MKLRFHTFIICLILSLFLYKNSQSQEIIQDKYIYPGKSYLTSYIHDGINTVKSPFYFNKKEWLITGSLAGAGLLAWNYDEEIQSFMNGLYNKALSNTGEYFLEPLGGGYATVPILATIWLFSYTNDNSKLTHFALQGAKAYIIARAISYVPKYLAQRERPGDQEFFNKNAWHGPSFQVKHTSFPSGHAASAFALASVISHEFSDKRWVAPLSYTAAGIVSFSRVYRNKHWASDMIAGCAIGLLTGFAINKMPDRLTLAPSSSDISAGIGVFYNLQ